MSALQSPNSSSPGLQATVVVTPPAATVMVTEECLCRTAWGVGPAKQWTLQSLKRSSLHTAVQGPFVVVKERFGKAAGD